MTGALPLSVSPTTCLGKSVLIHTMLLIKSSRASSSSRSWLQIFRLFCFPPLRQVVLLQPAVFTRVHQAFESIIRYFRSPPVHFNSAIFLVSQHFLDTSLYDFHLPGFPPETTKGFFFLLRVFLQLFCGHNVPRTHHLLNG